MNRKTKIIVSIAGIVLVSLILLGLTFGYYLTQITGNTNEKSITLSIANLELTYSDGNGLITAEKIIPGETIDTKTFTVENTGDAIVENYTVYLDDVVNTFADQSDVKLTLTCTSSTGGNCSGTTMAYPSESTMLSVNDIDVGEIHSYELTVEFLETNEDQSDNMNKSLSGNIKIKDLKSTDKTSETIASTNTITLNNTEYISNYRIYGNSIQEGTPSPTSPIEIQSVGDYDEETNKYIIPISITGKNLFDQDDWYNFYKNNNGSNLTLLENNITVDGYNSISWHPTNGHSGSYIIYPFNGKADTTYTITFTCKVAAVRQGVSTGIGFRYSDGTASSFYCGNSTEWNTVVGTTTAGKTVVGLFMPYNYGIRTYFQKESIRLYEGSYTLDTIDDYEPFYKNTYDLYLDEPLRKIGDCTTCTDYIDFQEQIVYRYNKAVTFDGTENWVAYGNGYAYYIDNNFNAVQYNSLMNNYFPISSEGDDRPATRFQLGTPSNRLYIFDDSTNSLFGSLAGLSSWLVDKNSSGKPLKIVYNMAKSESKSIELPPIFIGNAVNNISIGTSILPSNMEYEIIN